MEEKGFFKLSQWVRPNILGLKPYSSARDEFCGDGLVFLDANENPYETDLNRYPDPGQSALKKEISNLWDVSPEMLFVGNGSDEAIDLLIRASCESGSDRIISISPSYGMYKVCADIQGIEIDEVLLNEDFSLNTNRILAKMSDKHKLVFLCSPNNPTGNLLDFSDIQKVLESFSGVVIVDEAYIDFSGTPGFIEEVKKYPNLVLLRTFSKAWGMAGARCGMAIANPDIIGILSKIKYPYNVNILTQNVVLNRLREPEQAYKQLEEIVQQREILIPLLQEISGVKEVYSSAANFVLIRVDDATGIYKDLIKRGVVVRDRSSQPLCEGCLRITVGTPEENRTMLESLKELLS